MKLLSRTVQSYLIFSALLLLVSIPIFYYTIQQIFVHQMDRELLSHKKEFHELLPLLKTENDLIFFSLMNDEFILKETNQRFEGDSLVTRSVYNEKEKSLHPYRMLRTGVEIQRKHYVLQIQESLVATTDLILAIVTVQAVLITLLLLGFVFISRKLSRTIWGPFYTILDKLKKYQIDKHTSIDLPRSSTAEFRDLSTAISQLVNKNHDAFQSQKEFTENASHELQTPLAICRSKLELLAQTKELTQEQADLVGDLFNALDRITRLNKNLLLLSRIENRQFFETEEIELSPVVSRCLDIYDRQAQEKKLIIKMSMTPQAFIKANPVLLEVLFTNIISNAIRHTPESGTVTLEGTKTYIRVSNSGLPFDHPEKIFQRFHRESRTTIGNGLGLSIVKKVCDVAGFQIDYSFSSSMHHFKVTFLHSGSA